MTPAQALPPGYSQKAICRMTKGFLLQALRSLETGLDGWSLPKNWKRMTAQQLEYGLRVPNPERMVVLKQVRSPAYRMFV